MKVYEVINALLECPKGAEVEFTGVTPENAERGRTYPVDDVVDESDSDDPDQKFVLLYFYGDEHKPTGERT